MNNNKQISVYLKIQGRVQGVGFRPFIYQLAHSLGLLGWVRNSNEGVEIRLEGTENDIGRFSQLLHSKAPEASHIAHVLSEEFPFEGFSGFRIKSSQDRTDQEITEVSPDLAVCAACMEDMEIQPHRFHYPLINCTHCGPRFTIIRDLPYDRPNTTMDVFPMCETCAREYADVLNRRFHAQPVACNDCGPAYGFYREGKTETCDIEQVLQLSVDEIMNGNVLAIKGMGGFHLACNPFDPGAVERLRSRKQRETKPFAVMFASLDEARRYVDINPIEERMLTSWRRPILLLSIRKDLLPGKPAMNRPSNAMTTPPTPIASGVFPGLNTLGVMLPYMPFHYQLMKMVSIPAIILTSGNLSDDPIIMDNTLAIQSFCNMADALVLHEREIYNRVDDSVVRIMGSNEQVIRRARGYTPEPLKMPLDVSGILAMGAEMMGAFAMGKGEQALVSQYTGDLKNPGNQAFYLETLSRFERLFRFTPEMIAVDNHPEYFPSREGINMNVETIEIQHHHAHIASCMAEHLLDEPVIGVALDGTGYGLDGHTWGSEFMIADLEDFERMASFAYLPMPGGDKAVEEPWRLAVAALMQASGDTLDLRELPFYQSIGPDAMETVVHMIRKKVNTPLSCGAGRYFDAVAALLQLTTHAGYEGEAPMRLESTIREGIRECYEVKRIPAGRCNPAQVPDRYHSSVISFDPVFLGILEDIRKHTDPGIIAAKFHNSVIAAIFDTVMSLHQLKKISRVVLSGGVFQNRYLTENLIQKFDQSPLTLYTHHRIPSNDMGIALGQMAVAAKKRMKPCV